MQKKLIAVAVAGLVSGAAFAQSNVTVYGVVDMTFDRVQATGATTPADNSPARNRVSSNSSHIGFKGSEALGNGMTAVFQLESTVGPDAASGITLNRDSFVGVAGGFGTVAMGNLTGPTRGLGATMDVNSGATGIGANSGLLGKIGGDRLSASTYVSGVCTDSTTCASIFDTRWTNAIAYISPNFGGVSITAAYVANENKTRDGVSGLAAQRNTWGYDVGVKYEGGPILVGLTQNQAKIGDIYGVKATDTRAAARYNFGMGTVGVMFDRVQVKDNGAAAAPLVATFGGSDIKRNAWFIPVTFNVGAGKILAQYGQAGDLKGCGAAVSCGTTGAKLIEVGYEHSLSKRTIVKAVYAQIRNEADAYYDFGVNATGAMDGADPKGFQIGVRHSF